MDWRPWMDAFLPPLLEALPGRVAFVGIQGSFGRGEAGPESDVDLVVVLDALGAAELAACRGVLEKMPFADRACGFFCSKDDYAALLLMLSPFAPHMVEELWETLGFAAEKGGMACQQSWPAYDASKTVDAEVNMAVQVCGKLRGTITVPVDSGEEAVVAAALADPKVQKFTEGKKLVKTILVPNKLVNLIAK